MRSGSETTDDRTVLMRVIIALAIGCLTLIPPAQSVWAQAAASPPKTSNACSIPNPLPASACR